MVSVLKAPDKIVADLTSDCCRFAGLEETGATSFAPKVAKQIAIKHH